MLERRQNRDQETGKVFERATERIVCADADASCARVRARDEHDLGRGDPSRHFVRVSRLGVDVSCGTHQYLRVWSEHERIR